MGDTSASFLVFGGSGWIGGYLCDILEKQKERYSVAESRLENRESLTKEIEHVRPSHVLLAAGVVGRPNIDWCEDHQAETIRGNIIGILNLIDVCDTLGIHVTYYASGCIYHYDADKPEGSPNGFKESDPPNFTGSFYSKTKVIAEEMIQSYPNVLTLRLRMPMTSDLLNCPRNLISKLLKYKKLINIQNSMTVIPELLPLSIKLAKKKNCGIMNFVNPGTISHNEILELYQQYIDPDFQWENFTLEEQAEIVKAPRSNAHLDTSKLQSEFPSVLPIKESAIKYIFHPATAQKELIKEHVRLSRQ